MTYKELQQFIGTFSDEHLNQDVTVLIRETEEFYPLVKDYPVCQGDTDVLDSGHFYLVI